MLFFFIFLWAWTMFFYSALCFTITKLPVRLDHGHTLRNRPLRSLTDAAVSRYSPNPDLTFHGRSVLLARFFVRFVGGSCSGISAQPAPVTTKVMVIPLRAGERERDSYFTAHCVRHTPYGCFEACAQARSPDWGLVAGLHRIKAGCAVKEFHLWALVEAQCRLSLSSVWTRCSSWNTYAPTAWRFIEVGCAYIFSPILAEVFDTAELFFFQISWVTSWCNTVFQLWNLWTGFQFKLFQTSLEHQECRGFLHYCLFFHRLLSKSFSFCLRTPLQICRSKRSKSK